MKRYDDFKDMMLLVAEDIVKNMHLKGETVNITVSGGMDSTAVLLAIAQYTRNICVVHWNRGRGRYDDTLTNITKRLVDTLGVQYKQVSLTDDTMYRRLPEEGVSKFVFSDGFDIAFSEIYEVYPDNPGYPFGKTLSFSYGEWFRGHHPVVDVLCHLPGRFSAWRSSHDVSGYERLMSDIYLEKKYRDREGTGADVIDFDGHPLFVDFFCDYYTPFSDVFDRKAFVQLFIKEFLGVSHTCFIKRCI